MNDLVLFAQLPNVKLAYYDFSAPSDDAPVVILIHGFASTARVNWIGTGWVKELQQAGYRVVALDNRGHGQSEKFYDAADYGPDIFAADVIGLMDYLDIQRADIVGFSMGARITSWLAYSAPERVRKAVFGGMGAHIYGGRGSYEAIAEGLETDTPDNLTDPGAIAFRKFADRTRSDRLALAACVRPARMKITPQIIGQITVPVLVVVGSDDDIGGSPLELADQMNNAKGVVLEGLDHMKSTGAAAFKQAVLEFLTQEDKSP